MPCENGNCVTLCGAASPPDSLNLGGRGGTRRLRAAALESLAYDRGSATVDRWRVEV
jgi:hypothetical protein